MLQATFLLYLRKLSGILYGSVSSIYRFNHLFLSAGLVDIYILGYNPVLLYFAVPRIPAPGSSQGGAYAA